MKINAKNIKKHVREIKNATEDEISKLKEEYRKMMGGMNQMSSPGLLVVSLFGIFIILYFRNMFLDFIGILVFAYPFYLFIKKESHEEGFCEGCYHVMSGSEKGKNNTVKPEGAKEK